MNLNEIRTLVRTHLDLPDEDDLPTSLIDAYVREGFDRTMAYESQWPFLETTWEVSNSGGTPTITLPTNAQGNLINSLREVGGSGNRLSQLPFEYAEEAFPTDARSGSPTHFSIWGDSIYLWPVPSTERQFLMRGYRKPIDWVSGGAASPADGDVRLHILYAWYACSLAYAQQEDETLEAVYMQRWQTGVTNLRSQLMAVGTGRPTVYNKGLGRVPASPGWLFDLS